MTALAHDRYCSITKAIAYRDRTIIPSDRQQCLFQYLIPAAVGSVAVAIPVFGELQIRDLPVRGDHVVSPSYMRVNQYYTFFYIAILNNLVLGILPFCLSTYFYYKMWVFRTNTELVECPTAQARKLLQNRKHLVYNLAMMPLILYVIFNLPIIIVNIMQPIIWKSIKPVNMIDYIFCLPVWFHTLTIFSQLLAVIGCSINVLKYFH